MHRSDAARRLKHKDRPVEGAASAGAPVPESGARWRFASGLCRHLHGYAGFAYDSVPLYSAAATAFATPMSASDFDRDDDVGLGDFGRLQSFFNGPNRPPPLVGPCVVADLDSHGDVDLGDFSIFQRSFNVPNRPPSSP